MKILLCKESFLCSLAALVVLQNNAFHQNRTELALFERCSLQTISSCLQEKHGCGELVTSIEEVKFQGHYEGQAFSQSVACGKAKSELFLKKKASGVQVLPLEIEGSVLSGIP